MKKNLSYSVLAISTMVTLIFPGCRKAFDYVEDHPTATLPFCSIKEFRYDGEFAVNETIAFTYNALGDPVTVTRDATSTGSPDFLFKYDKKHRLSDLIGAYSIVEVLGVEEWHRYFYDHHDRIISDSFYFFPTIVNGRPTKGKFGSIIIITYEYDSKNRINRSSAYYEESPDPNVPFSTDTYSYDAKGNLVGPAAYDNKINLHRTNKIWMFLGKDYSVNNPVTGSLEYNVFGLPTKISVADGMPGAFFWDFYYTDADIKYSCR